ncbi:MAG: zinc ribbon domain-containing protein [Chloroflexi bacterium]|nr:zinc ribbon domain-containing protein [Chloroflexota bacterium]
MLATYEYQCDKCKSPFQVRRDWNAAATGVRCPACQSDAAHRVFSVVTTLSRGSDGAIRTIGASPCSTCTASQCRGCQSK